jgi:hypothetical protein
VEAPWHKQLEDNSEGELDGESDLSDAEFEIMSISKMRSGYLGTADLNGVSQLLNIRIGFLFIIRR